MTGDVLDWALRYAGQGWRVVPIPRGAKGSDMTGWPELASADPGVIREWWTGRYRGYGIGIATGQRSGVWVLDVDVDPEHDGRPAFDALVREHGPLPRTATVRTGGGGLHYYFTNPPGVHVVTRRDSLAIGRDVRGDGGQVVAPPSVHGTGSTYRWERAPWDGCPDVLAPDPWLALVVVHPVVPILYPRAEREGDSIAAWVCANYDIRAEMSRHGWQLRNVVNDREETWTRPGKDLREGHSAVVHTDTGVVVNWPTTLPELCQPWAASDDHWDYNVFGYLAATDHNGDRSRCASWAVGERKRREGPYRVHDPHTGTPGEHEHEHDEDDPLTSWRPVDLAPVLDGTHAQPRPTLLPRGEGEGYLLYPGSINGLHGDSGAGKGWVALAAIKHEIVNGRSVVLVDMEDTAQSVTARLRLLGVSAATIAARLLYIRPVDPMTAPVVGHLVALVNEHAASLVVVDSLGEAFGLHGINEDRDNEVGPWLRHNIRPLADTGAGVLLVDHSTKAADNPLHPSGSKRKRAAITGASYLVEAINPYVKGPGGLLRLTCAKDRHGTYRRGDVVALAIMSVYDGTTRIRLEPPKPEQSADDAQRDLAAQVVAVLRDEGGEMSQNLLLSARSARVKRHDKAVRAAIEVAHRDGAIAVRSGARNTHLHSYVRDLASGAGAGGDGDEG